MIIVKPENIDIPSQQLVRGFSSNNDGAGIMYARNEQIQIKKNVFTSYADFKKVYDEAKDHNNNGLMVVHFRIATSGEENQQNCHPFSINNKWALAHNGVFSGMSQRGDTFSDTAYFVQFLRHLPEDFMDDMALSFLVEDFIKKEICKVVFLSNSNKVIIVNESLGVWEDGCWYSNKSATYVNRTYNWTGNHLVCGLCNIIQASVQSLNYYFVNPISTRICDSCQEYILKQATFCPKCNGILDINHYCSDCEKIYSDDEIMKDFLKEKNYNFRGFP